MDDMNNADRHVYDLIQQILRWVGIVTYLEEQEGYQPSSNYYEEQQRQRELTDLNTFFICLLLYRRHVTLERARLTREPCDIRPYTLRKLAQTIDSCDDANGLKSAEGKIKRMLDKLEPYGIISTQRTQHVGNRECLNIHATGRLTRFIESKIFKGDSSGESS